MKEKDIRTDDNLEYRWSLYKKDQQRLLKKKNAFTDVACPACGSGKKIFYYKRDGFLFNRCKKCESVFVSPRPTQAMLLEHYQNSLAEKYWNEKIYPQTEKGRVAHIVNPRIDRILGLCEQHKAHYNALIDVGGGSGTFAEEVKKRGVFKSVFVVEPDPVPARICTMKGLEVMENFVENVEESAIADVITSFESIEHVFSPRKYIEGVYRLLKGNGLFIVTTPNIKGFDLCVLQDKSDNTTAPDHLNYFHPESLSLLLRSCGFEVLEVLTPGKLDVELVRKKVLSGSLCLDAQPFLKQIVVDKYDLYGDSFQQWLAHNGMSSHMWIVAQKAHDAQRQ